MVKSFVCDHCFASIHCEGSIWAPCNWMFYASTATCHISRARIHTSVEIANENWAHSIRDLLWLRKFFSSWLQAENMIDTHIPSGFCCHTVSIFEEYATPPTLYSGEEVMEHFFHSFTRWTRENFKDFIEKRAHEATHWFWKEATRGGNSL